MVEEDADLAGLCETVGGMAPDCGRNGSQWDGLVLFRHEHPTAAQPERITSLSLGVVVQGCLRVRLATDEFSATGASYIVMPRGYTFSGEVTEATPRRPFLSLLLILEPLVVNHVVATMRHRLVPSVPAADQAMGHAASPVNADLTSALTRFLRALDTEADQSMLGPIYLQEISYRLLRDEQGQQLAEAAQREADGNPVSVAIRHIQADLRKQFSVAELASTVGMSQSSFARLFKSTTGLSPHQFIKQMRLDRAGECLVEHGFSVSDTALDVGYSSVSHFINEFKRHFGVTPGQFAQSQWERMGAPPRQAGSSP